MSDVTELIREQLDRANGSLDYEALAEAIARDLSPEDQHHYMVRGLRDVVAAKVASLRPPATRGEAGRSARWDQVKDARDVLEDWWVGFQDRPSKPLLNCSSADLLDAADWYEKRAAGYQARAAAYTKLANTLRRRRASTPADLPREDVRGILDA